MRKGHNSLNRNSALTTTTKGTVYITYHILPQKWKLWSVCPMFLLAQTCQTCCLQSFYDMVLSHFDIYKVLLSYFSDRISKYSCAEYWEHFCLSKTSLPTALLHIPYFSDYKKHFFPEKCDLKSTCVLYAKGKYLFPNLWMSLHLLYDTFIVR